MAPAGVRTTMCIMAIYYQVVSNAPILAAYNREEFFDRPTQPPRIQSGKPRVVCGIDKKAGGTWLGINQYGLLAAVANRPKTNVPQEPRSRGLLCRELLNCRTAREAALLAAQELSSGQYAGANYVCVDAKYGAVVYGGNHVEIVELTPGLHILTNGDLNDPTDPRQQLVRRQFTLQRLDSSVTFLAVASRIFSRRPDPAGRGGVVLLGPEFGTVSSTLISLPNKTQHSILQYSNGPPCDYPYEDLSALLRQVLSTERASRKT
ncbi:MAG TPA: NRDE family protein [Thermoguttaceae bacterium]|nr:NRDE family protein [Thermoguttaceae bacterium]